MLLLFGSVWMFPLITALVAGDIVASEDHNGTLKTILTRSLGRGQIFAGKTLAAGTYAIAAILLNGIVAIIAGCLVSGFNPLTSLSGTRIPAPRALELVSASLLVYLMPILAVACIGLLLSAVTRNSAAAITGTLMISLLIQLIGILPGLGGAAALPAEHAVQRLAGAAARAGRLGADHPRRVGLLALRAALAARRLPGLPAPRRRRRLSSVTAGERVLVVDDDPPLQRMLARTLTAEGFSVAVAADGGAALAEVERSLPDVIVLDVAMPGMDGLAVCRRLRAKGMTTPVLMLTARDAVPDRVRGCEAGADDYLVKPFATEELIARIRALTRRGAPATERLQFADLALDLPTRTATRRPLDRAQRARGGAARAADARPAQRAHARARARAGVGRRGGAQRGRPLRRAAALQARRAAAHPHRARRGVHAAFVRPRTFRARLVAASLGSILAALALFGVAASAITAQELRSSLDRALEQRARDVARLSVSAPAVLTAPGALEAPGGGRQVVVEVLDGRRRIVARSLTLGARILPRDRAVARALAGHPGFDDLQLAGKPLRLYAAPLPDTGGVAAGGAVLVGSDTSDIERTLHRLRVLLVLAALGALLLAASVAAALLTRRGLRPLRRLSEAAREIERVPDPGRRMPPATTDDEIGGLTEVLNGMLAALDRARDSERRFLADASHELRTPVTSLLGNVEYAARHGADAELLAELRHDAERLGRLVDDLLTLERERSGLPERRPVRLDALVREAAEAQPRVELGRVDPAVAEGDEDALRRAVGNLIENAVVHGPPDTPVDVSLVHDGAGGDHRARRRERPRGGRPRAPVRALLARRRCDRPRRLGPRPADRRVDRRRPRRPDHGRGGGVHPRAARAG